MINRSFLTFSLYEKRVAMKQQFTENVQTQAFISTSSHLHPTHGHEECKKI